MKPTIEQLAELHLQITAGTVTRASLQTFLEQGKAAESLKPVPDTNGLRIIKVMVRGSDSRWSKIEPGRYAYCNETARTGDFPVDPTDREVTVAIFPANYFDRNPTNEALRAEIERRNLTHPDRAVTETTLDVLKDELADKPTVGVCGVVQSDTDGDSIVGYVYEVADGRRLSLIGLRLDWPRDCQFVAVVSE
ncbi:MAG: hypothetical protein WCV88_06275 [Patescibacteria group bacterium]|jgi:hypothetical protein